MTEPSPSSTRRGVALDAYDPLAGSVGLRTFFGPPQSSGPRLYCFPPVGGYSLVFKPLAQHLAGAFTVSAIDPPGHGASRGRPLTGIEAMADAYLAALGADRLAGAFLLGHSLGAYVVAALTRRLEALGRPPLGVVLSAAAPYHRRAEQRRFEGADDETLLASLVELGGMAPQLLADREIFDLFKDVIRIDFGAYEQCPEPPAALKTRALVVGARDDALVRPEWLDEWGRYLERASVVILAGHHFFVSESPAPLAAELLRLTI